MKTTILYVDDDLLNLEIFAYKMNQKYNVITAMSGLQGLTALNTNSEIKIVISDMKMPGMNGIEFIKNAKKKFPNIICYILTGYAITEEIASALNEKIIEKYFNKPYNMKDLEFVIDAALK